MIDCKNMKQTNEQNVRLNNIISLRKEKVPFFQFDNEQTALSVVFLVWMMTDS